MTCTNPVELPHRIEWIVAFRFRLSHCVDSEKFSGRNQSIGCALAWVTIGRVGLCRACSALAFFATPVAVNIFIDNLRKDVSKFLYHFVVTSFVVLKN